MYTKSDTSMPSAPQSRYDSHRLCVTKPDWRQLTHAYVFTHRPTYNFYAPQSDHVYYWMGAWWFQLTSKLFEVKLSLRMWFWTVSVMHFRKVMDRLFQMDAATNLQSLASLDWMPSTLVMRYAVDNHKSGAGMNDVRLVEWQNCRNLWVSESSSVVIHDLINRQPVKANQPARTGMMRSKWQWPVTHRANLFWTISNFARYSFRTLRSTKFHSKLVENWWWRRRRLLRRQQTAT